MKRTDLIKKKIARIEKKYPFKLSLKLLRDLEKWSKLVTELIYAEVDNDRCKSDDPDMMCSNCDCWKKTRRNCG